MRKLTSKESERKKQKRNQVLVGIVLIGVLVVSVFGIFVNSFGQNQSPATGNQMEYKGYQFFKDQRNNVWITQIGQKQFAFKYSPQDIIDIVENSSEINFSGNIKTLNNYANRPLYVYSEDYNSKLEIYRNLYNTSLRTQDACPDKNLTNEYSELKPLSCENEWPVKNCQDNFIIINSINESSNGTEIQNKIIQKDNCLIISGEKRNLIGLTDKALLKIIGVE